MTGQHAKHPRKSEREHREDCGRARNEREHVVLNRRDGLQDADEYAGRQAGFLKLSVAVNHGSDPAQVGVQRAHRASAQQVEVESPQVCL